MTTVSVVKPTDASAMFFVIDTNATEAARRHEPLKGVFYSLTADKPTAMKREHAFVFLRDPSFVVTDEAGRVVPPISEEARMEVRRRGLTLQPGQIVARLEELSDEALISRCVARPGGEKVSPTDRNAMLAFLADTAMTHDLPEAERGRTRSEEIAQRALDAAAREMGIEVDEMDDAETAQLVGQRADTRGGDEFAMAG